MITMVITPPGRHTTEKFVMDSTPSPPSTLSADLVKRVAKGDTQAFGQLYDYSSELLFTLAHRILGQRDEAIETLQEAYLEAWHKAGRFDTARGTPMAWLVALTRTRAIERLHARHARTGAKAAATGKVAGQIVDASPPLDTETQDVIRQTVASGLAALSNEQCRTLELAYYEGLNTAEIAVRNNEPIGSVKATLIHAMAAMRDSLHSSPEPHQRYGT